MNVLSFSLFGSNALYCHGAVRNAEQIKSIYPGWKAVFYVADDVPKATLAKLRQLGAEIRGPVENIPNQMFWRFCIADDPDVERYCVRDTDSRLSRREFRAVQAWIDSERDFHVMRDHPHHWLPVGGGLWGGKARFQPSIQALIQESRLATQPYTFQTGYSLDQTFLSFYLWPTIRKSCLQHDSCCRQIYPEALPFPDQMETDRFVGEVFGPDDKPNPLHWQMRCNHKYA